MRRKLSLSAAAAALVALGVVVGSLPIASGHDRGKDTLRFFSPYRAQTFEEVDVNEDGPSVGDYFVGTFDLRKKGKKRGIIRFQCVRTNPGTDLCHAMTWIKGKGNIAFIGSSPTDSENFRAAVSGGTGAYSGVAGRASLEFGRAGIQVRISVLR